LKHEISRLPYTDVALCAPVTVPYERYSIRSAHWFFARALASLLDKAGLDKRAIDGFCISSFTLAPDSAVGLTQHLGVSPRWLDDIPFGGGNGVVALRRAARAVQCGDAAWVACIAADTHQVDSFRSTVESFSQFANDAVYPYGSGGPNASFAFLTDHYMHRFAAQREDFARLCIAQRENALENPNALMKSPLTMQDYLGARPVAEPLGLFDCVMPCAGAEGFLVTTVSRARDAGVPHVVIRATIERHNAYPEDPIQIRGGWAMDRDELYECAGCTPNDLDFVQLYDDYPVICFLQLEDLGFCAKGDAAHFVREHDLRVRGDFPLNTSGGQLSTGQAGVAGGFLGLVESIRQLTGDPIGFGVPDAQLGLVSCFGMINYDRGVCSSAAILARGD
jgi:acetyl-CoA acetyltransferase